MEECEVKFGCKYFILCLESKELERFENFQAEIHQKIYFFLLKNYFPSPKISFTLCLYIFKKI